MMGGLGIGGAEAAPAPPPPVTGGGFGTPLSYSQGGFWTPDIAGAPESNPFQMMYHPTYAEGIQSAQTAGVIAPNVANAVSGWSNNSSDYFKPQASSLPQAPSSNGPALSTTPTQNGLSYANPNESSSLANSGAQQQITNAIRPERVSLATTPSENGTTQPNNTLSGYRASIANSNSQPVNLDPNSSANQRQFSVNDYSNKSNIQTLGKMNEVKGMTIHHTGANYGENGAAKVSSVLNNRGLGVQYFIDKQGQAWQLTSNPNDITQHMRVGGTGTVGAAGMGLGNHNMIGVEVEGAHAGDINDAQRIATRNLASYLGKQFGFSPENVFGHGELNGHKEFNEGLTDAKWIRQYGFGWPRPFSAYQP